MVIYYVYWPLLFGRTCTLQLVAEHWILYAWTLLPGLTPILAFWFDRLKRRKDLDLQPFTYILMVVNVMNFYGGLTFLSFDYSCLERWF